jgi:uncharacterized protein YidB (DUF937 family)
MERSRKAGFGMVALVALALVAAYAVGVTTQGWVFASPNAQTSTGSGTQQTTTPGSDSKQAAAAKEQQILDIFMTNFASRLGVDEAKLNSSFADAVNSTVDQAVRDGIITQDQADSAKSMVQKGGFRGIIASGISSGAGRSSGSPDDAYANPKAALVQTMNNIGVSIEQLQQGMNAGKSLVDLAAQHNVDAPTLKNMILQTYRTQLDAAVHEGNLPQAKADDQYNQFAAEIDGIIARANSPGNK